LAETRGDEAAAASPAPSGAAPLRIVLAMPAG
jgi:hypothetical protein